MSASEGKKSFLQLLKFGLIGVSTLNGIAYKDDSQIVALLVFKRFGEPRVEVNIMGGDLCSSAV